MSRWMSSTRGNTSENSPWWITLRDRPQSWPGMTSELLVSLSYQWKLFDTQLCIYFLTTYIHFLWSPGCSCFWASFGSLHGNNEKEWTSIERNDEENFWLQGTEEKLIIAKMGWKITFTGIWLLKSKGRKWKVQ